MENEMCSGETLQDRVDQFCIEYKIDQGELWQIINRIHQKDFGENVISKKNEYEKNNKLGDISLSQWFAQNKIVNHAFIIIDGIEKCIINNWPLE